MNMTEIQPEFRTLVGDDVKLMAEKLKDLGFTIPYPQLATIEVAVVAGELAGFCCTQLMFHTEPMYVFPKYRGTGIAEGLADRASAALEQSHAKTYLCVASTEFAEKLCRDRGMVEVPGKMFIKR